jgi:hypothetical protein
MLKFRIDEYQIFKVPTTENTKILQQCTVYNDIISIYNLNQE